MPLSSKFELQKLIVAILLQFLVVPHDFCSGFLFWPIRVGSESELQIWVRTDLSPIRFGPVRFGSCLIKVRAFSN